MSLRCWCALAGLVLAACGSQGAGQAGEGDEGEAAAAAIDAEGFEVSPAVPYPGPAVTEFGGGDRLCVERRAEITPEVANVIGYDVEGDRAVLEATQVVAASVSYRDVKPTIVHHRGRIVRILRVDRHPPTSGHPIDEAVPVGCPNGVEYELLQQLYTEDGAVRGAFLTHVPATKLEELTARHLFAEVDLRNFVGELPVGMFDTDEPQFTTARLAWTVGDIETPSFELVPIVWGGPGYDMCEQPFCRLDSDLNIPISYGVSTAIELDSFDDMLAGFANLIPQTLTQLAARPATYEPHVRIWVTANSANSSDPSSANRVHVTARAGEQPIAAGTLELAPDADRLPDGIVSGFIDVGPIREGTTLDLTVDDEFGLGSLRSHIIVNDCDVPRGTAICAEPGCSVQSSFSVLAAGCAGRASYQAH